MKTIDFKSYSEKLKINPVDLDTFDNIGVCSKSSLKTFDIVRIWDDLFVVFLLEDAMKYLKHTFKNNVNTLTKEGVFIWFTQTMPHVMLMDDYNESLDFIKTKNPTILQEKWSVTDVYKHLNDSVSNDIINSIYIMTQEDLENFVCFKNYKHIKIR